MEIANQFYNEHQDDLICENQYYRFDVGRGLDHVGLEEAAKKAVIAGATEAYLRKGDIFSRLVPCAELLVLMVRQGSSS